MRLKEKLSKKQIIYLILIAIWMIAIFIFSNQPGTQSENTSESVTSKVINIASQIINIEQNTKENLIQIIDPIMRKLAHFTIYLIGGFLIMNFANTYKAKETTKIAYSIIAGMIYAGTDELHQYFIEGRSCLITDVFIDTLGVTTGVYIFLLMFTIYKKIKNKGIKLDNNN